MKEEYSELELNELELEFIEEKDLEEVWWQDITVDTKS